MSPELLLLKEFCYIDQYKKYRDLVPKIESDLIAGLYKALDRLLEEVARSVSLEELEAFYGLHMAANFSKEERQVVSEFFNDLRTSEVGSDVVNSCIRTIVERDAAAKLATEFINVVEGRRSFKDVLASVASASSDHQTQTISGQDYSEFVDNDLEKLYNESYKESGLRWRLGCLNQSLGSLRKGDFGFIFARPETGKTTFLASEITGFANSCSSSVLWFNNEEQGNKVVIRCYQAALGINLQELMKDRNGNQQKYLELTKGNLRIFDSAAIYKRQVEQLCQKYQPALIIFDQIDKLKGFDADREDLHLGAIYQWARELAKTYCPVIAVCQAAGTAEGKKWLTMDDITSSKTTKAAEADFIIGIGKTHEVGYEYIRYLNIIKNKLQGDEDTLPELRHSKHEVMIQPEIGRYRDI